MNNNSGFNTYLCHAILNTLFAGLQGRYARLNMLSKFYPTPEIDWELSITSNNIDALSLWIKELWAGHALDFSKEDSALTGPAKNALKELTELKSELITCLENSIEIIANLNKRELDHQEAVTLTSLLVQRAYSREHYIRGLIDYANYCNNAQESELWKQHMNSCFSEMTSAHTMFEELLVCDEPNNRLSEEIIEECRFLPALLTCQIHDINQISVIRNGKFEHQDIELPGCNPEQWKVAGIPPEHAGYWHAYGLTPDDVYRWIDHGFYEPSQAGCWYQYGFTPEKALEWSIQGFAPKEAATCVNAGLSKPELAKVWSETEGLVH